MLASLADSQPQKQRITFSHSIPFQDNVNTTPVAWIGSSIYGLPWHMPDLKGNKSISLLRFVTGQTSLPQKYLSVLRTGKGRKRTRRKAWEEFIFGVSEQLPASLSVLCALGSILGFYVSAFYAHSTCRLKLSCKDRIIWVRWLACGLWIKWFLLNVRLYEKI